MDTLKAFVETMTIWNWLALFAFLIALVGGLNAFLSLKARWLDWRGTKNQVAFKKRTEELRVQLAELDEYKNNTTRFFIAIIRHTLDSAFGVVFGFVLFVIGVLASGLDTVTGTLFMLLALGVFVISFVMAAQTARLAARMHEPESFALEVIKFVRNAAKKGFTSSEADAVIVALAQTEFLTETERKKVFDYIGAHYPQVLSTIWTSLQRPAE